MMVEYDKLEVENLIILVRERDDFAFAELVRRYTPMVNKLISGFSSDSVSYDEAFSEACVALHKASLTYKLENTDVTFGLYARICAKRRLSDLYSAKDSLSIDGELDVEKISAGSNVESMLLLKERVRSFISCARDILSDYEYRVFMLYIQGYDTDSMCELLSRDKKSIENAKARMLKILRSESQRFADI
jgi:RNA polymerase sigma factor (sigma-70 family)